MFRVFLGLGSNLGDRLAYLTQGIRELSTIGRVRSLSSVYETEPVDNKHQPKFLNVVLHMETWLMPLDLFKEVKAIEKRVGRKDTRYHAPREIDIDILLYEGWSFENNILSVPHRELEYRRFVLEPLSEIASTTVHPLVGQTISSLLRQCHDPSRVMRTSHILPLDL